MSKQKRGIVVDWFAGGGGASTGIRAALGRPIDIALNHNAEAVAMHRINHPETRHIEGNAWDYTPRRVVPRGQKVDLAWFSPDCTFHSKARGGKPFRDRNAARRLRGLPYVPLRWAKEVHPNVIMLENVEEMSQWGPLLPDGKIDPKRRGLYYRRWCRQFQDAGYTVDMRELKAHEYGAPTSRKRLFVIARRDGEEIVFPEETHGPSLIPFRTAAECIDWDIEGTSIFGRAKELAPATMRRIYRGYMRYVVNNPRPFIVPLTHQGDSRVHSIDEPFRTLTCASRGEHALVVPYIVPEGFGEREGQAPRIHSIDEPLGTVMATRNRHNLVLAFLAQHNGGFFDEKGCSGRTIDRPMPTVTRQAQQALVTAHVMKMRGDNVGSDLRDPLHTVSAGGQHHALVQAFLMSYYGTDQAPRIDSPAPTVRTKDHLAIVTVHGQPWHLVDIKMRMFTPRELFRAQSFKDSYIIDRGLTEDGETLPLCKTSQIRMCGNSVPPVMSEALVRANLPEARQ